MNFEFGIYNLLNSRLRHFINLTINFSLNLKRPIAEKQNVDSSLFHALETFSKIVGLIVVIRKNFRAFKNAPSVH
jgi:hypothetical protein